MTDDHGTSPASGDERDEELAARLAVTPLDELTRRRLVRGALDASAPAPGPARRRSRAALVAAAASIVVAGVVTAVALRSGPDDHPTAARAPTSTGAPAEKTPAAAPSDAFSAAAPADLGNLGEVADRATLRTQVAAAGTRALTQTPSGSAAGRPDRQAGAPPTTVPCAGAVAAAHPGFGPVLASGSATFHGAPATVVVTTTAAGERVAVVVVDAGCVVESPVTLAP